MTYCVGMLLDAGLVCLADSRTNAGVDHINSFRKLNLFQREGERVMVLMTAGNLAITQSLVSMLNERLVSTEGTSLWSVPNLFEAARHVGDMIREVYHRDAESLKAFGIDFNASLILAGQIRGERPRLFNIYAAGNFIEATPETPYFQIGESKYGKPILDRVVTRRTSLHDAAKCALISMDSTIRSNLSVGLPLDLAIVRADAYRVARHVSITADDPYFSIVRSEWGEALRHAFDEMPNPDWVLD